MQLPPVNTVPAEIKYELKIDEPVVQDLFEPHVDLATITEDIPETPTKRYNTTHHERQLAQKTAEKYGYVRGTTVVKRSENVNDRTEPEKWGFVLDTVCWTVNLNGEFAPIKCKWLDGSTTFHWPYDLIVVNYSPDDLDLQVIREGKY